MEEQIYLGKQFHAKHKNKPVRIGFDTLPWMTTHRIITKNTSFILVTKWCLLSLEFRERTLVATSEILTSQSGKASDSLRGKGEISNNQRNGVGKETREQISDMKINRTLSVIIFFKQLNQMQNHYSLHIDPRLFSVVCVSIN